MDLRLLDSRHPRTYHPGNIAEGTVPRTDAERDAERLRALEEKLARIARLKRLTLCVSWIRSRLSSSTNWAENSSSAAF